MAVNSNYRVSAHLDKSPMARSFMSKVAHDDYFQEDIACTARVHVFSAFFDSMYQGPGSLPRPYLKVLGETQGIFLENENEVFPTGTNEIDLIEAQPLDLNIQISDIELGDLCPKGLFRKGGIEPPANLIDNVIEIPLTVRYIGVYDTPLCTIGVPKAFEIDTSTYENGYVALFDGCRPHRDIEVAMAKGISIDSIPFDPVYGAEMQDQQAYVFGNEDEDNFEDQVAAEQDYNEPAVEDEAAVPDKFREITERSINKVKTAEGFDAKALVRSIREQADKAQEDKIRRAEMLGDPEEIQKAMRPMSESEHYRNLTEAAVSESEKQRKEAESKIVQADIAEDLKAMNEGNYDIAGAGASDSSKAEADRKKAEGLARQYDVAKDLEAMNAGNYDIAGAGASEAKKPTREGILNFLRPKEEPQKGNDGPEML